jgi:hypothetical protein
MRVWTRTEAIECLEDYRRVKAHGGMAKLKSMPLSDLTAIMVAEGYGNFTLTED